MIVRSNSQASCRQVHQYYYLFHCLSPTLPRFVVCFLLWCSLFFEASNWNISILLFNSQHPHRADLASVTPPLPVPLLYDNESFVENIARVYLPQNRSIPPYSWCHPTQLVEGPSVRSTHSTTGLLFVKNPKAASSTGAGVTLQIALNMAQRLRGDVDGDKLDDDDDNDDKNSIPIGNNRTMMWCPHQFRHAYAARGQHALRDPSQSFLWTTVRHPAQTALSAYFFFTVSQNAQRSPTPEHMQWALEQHKSRQVDFLAVSPRPAALVEDNGTSSSRLAVPPPTSIQQWMETSIFQAYDFIAVVERMEESLVVLKYLLHLEWRDIIVLSSKQAGSYFPGSFSASQQRFQNQNLGPNGRNPSAEQTQRCVRLQKPVVPPTVRHYLETEFTIDNWDYVMYAAANRSLDKTMDALGRDRIQDGVRQLRRWMELAQSTCERVAKFPCTMDGHEQLEASARSCLAEDCACGYQCVQEALRAPRI